jgi:hypothetical protein
VTLTFRFIGLLAQDVSFEVITAVGVAVKIMFVESEAAKQSPFPVVVTQTVTIPAAVSAVLGI